MRLYSPRRPGRGSVAVLLAGLLAASIWPAPVAHAQNLFQALFGSLIGGLSGRGEVPYRRDDRYPLEPQQAERPMSELRGNGTICVRLCDGRYFPIPRSANGVTLNAAKVCSSLCPMARTQVFHGSRPEYAVAGDGTRYAELANAFAFRERVVADCTCTGHGPGGLAQIDVESDPTLRAGDIVAMSSGLTVFRGSGSFPHGAADFTPIESYASVNSELRRKLGAVKVDQSAKPSTPAQSLATAEEDQPAATTRRGRPPAQAARNQEIERSPFGWFR